MVMNEIIPLSINVIYELEINYEIFTILSLYANDTFQIYSANAMGNFSC